MSWFTKGDHAARRIQAVADRNSAILRKEKAIELRRELKQLVEARSNGAERADRK